MGRIETWFGRTSTAEEVVRGIDLSGTRVIVTGASSGIGFWAADQLAAAGARVVLLCRDRGRADRALAALRA